MEALNSLGINGKMLIAQIANFVILLLLLNWLLYKPLLKLFDQRREKIEQGLRDAESSQKALHNAETDAEKIKEKAYKEANEIISQAKIEAEKEAKSIIADSHHQAEKVVQSAASEARNIKDNAQKEIKSSISDLLSLALDKITVGRLDSNTREKLTQETIKDL